MLDHARRRTQALQRRLADAQIDVAILTDESSIAYFGGFWGYLGVEFGRPSFLVVPAEGAPTVVTPKMECEMIGAMSWIERIAPWEDAGPRQWPAVLSETVSAARGARSGPIGFEAASLPAMVRLWRDETLAEAKLADLGPIVAGMRMIKGPEEIEAMRQAGKIAGAMMGAAEGALAEGAPEYEAALAVMAAGTRAAAGFLTDRGWEAFVSPLIHGLQIMQSGEHTSMVHRRASVKRLERGDPVYFCFCTLAEFKLYKLGFDRMFFIKEASDRALEAQQAAIDAQAAAIAAIKPGVAAETVAAAANAVYAERGFEVGYRTGRAIGMSALEAPELKEGDKTLLQPGMTFAVDGGVSAPGDDPNGGGRGAVGGRIGDSVVVTAEGCDYLTDYPRGVRIVDR